MVKTQNLVPEVYYDKSRDFQLLGRTYDIVFNYLKYNADTIYNIPLSENSDDNLISLMATTLGFKQAHEYNIKQLRALCSIFALALRNKGNINSINYILNLLSNVENINEKFMVVIDPKENPYLLKIFMPQSIKDTTLLEDILDYVLPAGMTYQIIKQILIVPEDKFVDTYTYDTVKATITRKHEFETSQILQPTKEVGDARQLVIPKESDIGIGRLDNEIIVGYPDKGTTDIETYIKEEQASISPSPSHTYPTQEE